MGPVTAAEQRPRSRGRRRAAKTVLVGLGVCGLAVVISLAILYAGGRISPSDPSSAPEKARAAAAWVGMHDTAKMDLIDFTRRDVRAEGWQLIWEATPEQADRALASMALTARLEACTSEPAPDDDHAVVDGCRTIREIWRRPDGNDIERRVVRGRTRRGTYIVYVHVVDPD